MADHDLLIDGDPGAEHTFIFAHGAGGPMRSAWMARVARAIAARGVRVVRFEFPYMAARKKAPDRPPVLLERFREVVGRVGKGAAIGGKSMGGRIATMVADELNVAAVVCFGYPFHPPGQPTKLRTEHLRSLRTPTLILQGERDSFGSRDDVSGYELSKAIRVSWLPDGDHSLKPRASSGATEEGNLARAVEEAVIFLTSRREIG
jgi:predicted alpha/beta-hydrolase family hydrolase